MTAMPLVAKHCQILLAIGGISPRTAQIASAGTSRHEVKPWLDGMAAKGSVDLRDALRASESNEQVEGLIRETVFAKPERHHFLINDDETNGITRHMSVLGG